MTNPETKSAGGFKTRLAHLELAINTNKRELAKLTRLEECSRKIWTKAYHVFLKAAQELSELKHHGTKKEAALKTKIKDWPVETATLTRQRDAFRKQIKELEQSLVTLGTKRAMLLE